MVVYLVREERDLGVMHNSLGTKGEPNLVTSHLSLSGV